jgi:hypothetical protein
MKYAPSNTGDQDLVDIDALNDTDPLPGDDAPEPAPKKVKGPSAFNPKANQALPNITIWLLMAFVSWLVLPYIAGPLEAVSSYSQKIYLSGAGGLGLGGMLMWRANRSGNHTPYSNTHMFLFISLGLSLTGWLPEALTFSLLGPLLVGFGVGSFVTTLLLSWRVTSNKTTPVEEDSPQDDDLADTP